jgi:hypothetical protein
MNLKDYKYDYWASIVFEMLKEYAFKSKDQNMINFYKVVKKRLDIPKTNKELYLIKTRKRKESQFANKILSDLIIKGIVTTLTSDKGEWEIVTDLTSICPKPTA